MGAVSSADCARLDEVHRHRHDLAHELRKYLVDPDVEPDIDLLVDALSILRKIDRFWGEADIGTFDEYEDLDLSDVSLGTTALLSLAVQAYLDGLPASAVDSDKASTSNAVPDLQPAVPRDTAQSTAESPIFARGKWQLLTSVIGRTAYPPTLETVHLRMCWVWRLSHAHVSLFATGGLRPTRLL
jgi:hypothetical protein